MRGGWELRGELSGDEDRGGGRWWLMTWGKWRERRGKGGRKDGGGGCRCPIRGEEGERRWVGVWEAKWKGEDARENLGKRGLSGCSPHPPSFLSSPLPHPPPSLPSSLSTLYLVPSPHSYFTSFQFSFLLPALFFFTSPS